MPHDNELFIVNQAFESRFSAFNYLNDGALHLAIELGEQNAPIEWTDVDLVCLGNP